jgi:hypothetical protein
MSNTPPEKYQHIQHHWLVSERASHPCLAEWIEGDWYCAGETNPISPEEMTRRGWEYGGPAVPPENFRDDAETPVEGYVEGDVARTTDLIKDALRDQQRARERKDEADEAVRQARIALYNADDRVSKLCRQLLEEQLGSAYDARLVLYHMTGKRN